MKRWWLILPLAGALLLGVAGGATTASGQTAPSAAVTPASVTSRVVEQGGKPVSNATIVVVRDRDVRTKECISRLLPKAGSGDGFAQSGTCIPMLRSEGAVRLEAVSGEQGQFVLNVPSGMPNFDHLQVEAVAPDGTQLFGELPFTANLPGSNLPATVVLYRYYDFIVTVVGNGQPIAGAEVIMNGWSTYRTNKDGAVRARFRGSLGESLMLMNVTVRAPGYADEAWLGGVAAENTTRVITLIPERRVSGRVLDPSGRPVPDATIRLEAPWLCGMCAGAGEGDVTILTMRPDADGRFTLGRINPARTYDLVVVPPAGSSLSQTQRLIENGNAPGDVMLGAAGRLNLKLRLAPLLREHLWPPNLGDPRRGPLGGQLSIEWFDPSSGQWQSVLPPQRASAARSGLVQVKFEQVPAGLVRVSTRNWSGAVVEEPQPVSIVAGKTVELALDVRAISRPLRVQVLDARGRPIAGAEVESDIPDFRWATDTANAKGIVDIEVHPERELRIKVLVSNSVVVETVLPPGAGIPPVLVLRAR